MMYSDIAMFFHDGYGGDLIGVVWKPVRRIPRPWKVNLGFSSMPADAMGMKECVNGANGKENDRERRPSHMSVPNLTAIVAEMGRLGERLVMSVEFARSI
jgi:U3 small nucleolar RNA-associated protein 22